MKYLVSKIQFIILKKEVPTSHKKFVSLIGITQGGKSPLEDIGNIIFKCIVKTSYFLRCFFLFTCKKDQDNYTEKHHKLNSIITNEPFYITGKFRPGVNSGTCG